MTLPDVPAPDVPRPGALLPDVPLADFLEEAPPEAPRWFRVLVFALAVLVFFAGIAGVLLPLVPGIPLLVLAVWLLARTSHSARRALNAVERRLPHRLRVALRTRYPRKATATEPPPAPRRLTEDPMRPRFLSML